MVIFHLFLQKQYGSCKDGIAKLPSLQCWLEENFPSIKLVLGDVAIGGAYEHSVMIMTDVINALQKVEDAAKFFATDFCHQYTQSGGYGNIWGLVTCDPDGTFDFFSFYFLSLLSLTRTHITNCNWTPSKPRIRIILGLVFDPN